ncbi:hypothetical protein FQN57_005846 [Myotisia sp. PD_48]|nr:hypothetical protein FQN57_005846 [Myotisia sp. PD_48]
MPGRSRHLFVPPSWNHTPNLSPAPSDVDSDDDRIIMDCNQPIRPLSVAIPGAPPRPTLDDVLANRAAPPYTLTAFMAYLSQNHCLETLEFTMDAKRYSDAYMAVSAQVNQFPVQSDAPQADHLCMLWQRLLGAYIIPGSPREINLPSVVRDALLKLSNSRRPIEPSTLDTAVRRIHDLMDESIFIPFLNSRASYQQPQPVHAYSTDYRDHIHVDDRDFGRHSSMRRRLSPQPSFVSPRSTGGGYFAYSNSPSSQPVSNVSRVTTRSLPHGYASGDSGTLTDDSGSSMPSSPGAAEPMTPPTTPPSSEFHSPKGRSDNAFKKMMKFGFKKKSHGGSGGSSSGSSGAGGGHLGSRSREGTYHSDDLY